MSREESQFGRILDELSLTLVTLDPEDLIALGELLENLEKLGELAASVGPAEAGPALTGMQKALEAVILEQVKDKDRVIELIGEGIGLLQEMARTHQAGQPVAADLGPFMSGLKAEAGIEIKLAERGAPAQGPSPTPDGEKPEAPEEEPPREQTAEEPVQEEPAAYDASQDQDLFFGFITESMEHIESIEVNIISLEQDPSDKETLNSVFRPFHTIKGVSGFLNLREIHGLTHDVENVLDDARHDRIPVTPALIDVVLDAVDLLKRMIEDVKASVENGETRRTDYEISPLVERIKSIQQGDMAETPSEPGSSYSGEMLGEILLDQGLISSEELTRILQNQEQGRLRRLGEIVVERGLITTEDLEKALALQMEHQEKKLGEILIETGLADPGDVNNAIKEQAVLRDRKIGEILVKEKQAGAREITTALREQRKSPESGAGAGQTVKVDTIKLDGLVDLVGELVIAQSLVQSNEKVAGIKDQKLYRDLSHMQRITSELQRTAMSMRMVPIRQTFQKMIRLVRDLSRKSGKQVDLVMFGEETEIDRNMVEAIYDPLVHMIRNSVDHGVEPPEARLEKKKPAEGRINLRAFHQGGNVVIEIEDDGQGLNRDKILAKAVERGLVSPEENLSDSAVYHLIFQPGFSTAEKITDVSGRGVGMDVVKKAIDKLRGKIEVNSVLGKGSTITIRLPLTLAIIDGMIVRVGNHRYILPTVAIHESFRPTPGDYHTVKNQGEMIKVRQNLLPLVRLGGILNANGAEVDPTKALVVVVENEGERRCIMVDEVLGKQEVVIKSLGERLRHVRALAGGSILGDGRVGLILDVAGVFEVSDGFSGGIPHRGGAAAGVDDDWEMDSDWGMGAG